MRFRRIQSQYGTFSRHCGGLLTDAELDNDSAFFIPVAPMQPSELEIRREVEALRDIRRRSSAQGGPGAIPLDPDLPELPPSPSSPLSPQKWTASSSTSDEEGHESDGSDDPSHLFWVPARLHPELAPGEFRAFLKEHARDGGAALQRTNSASSSASSSASPLGRRKSMLSRQYDPSEHDGVEEERVVPIRRNKSGFYSKLGPQLTINDLQKLEELAEEASKSDDPSKLRSMLRRSLSLNVAPSLIDQVDDMPDIDEADSPIIVPRPNQILRRAARTKIRKPNLQGDGGGHRFPSTRRGAPRAHTIATSDVSSSDQDHEELLPRPQVLTAEPHEDSDARPISYSDEAFILDAYAERRDSLTSSSESYEQSYERSDDDIRERTLSTSPPPFLSAIQRSTSPPDEPPLPSRSPPPSLHHPMPQRQLTVPSSPIVATPSRTPSPHSDPGTTTEIISTASSAVSTPSTEVPPTFRETSPPPQIRPHQPPSPSPSRKEKEKKGGLFGRWGSKEDKKKGSKVDGTREKETREREKEKEKDSGFFGSFFGGKKKHDDSASTPGLLHGGSGPATAAALLGASRSNKSYVPSPSPKLAGAYARYPIHVERAVYRLSHIKLANPRRPLYEQVLISNLMFWYLGVINKAQGGGAGTATAGAASTNVTTSGQGQEQGQEQQEQRQQQLEREHLEREQRERAERERQERERAEQGKRESVRKGSLTKAHKPGSESGGSRRAEMPVRGPQYESQHRAMEQEYGYGTPSTQGGAVSPPIRTGSAPPAPMAGGSGYHNYTSHRMSPQPMMQNMSGSPPGQHSMQQGMQSGQYYYNPGTEVTSQTAPINGPYTLPPGAMMPPLSIEQTWLSPTGSGQAASSSHPGSPSSSYTYASPPPTPPGQNPQSAPPRRPRSPPPNHLTNQGSPKHPTTTPPGARLQGRSLSATAVAPQQQPQNGRLKKKHASASANVAPPRRRSSDGGAYGDEDLPLAVWQQQQRAGARR